MPDFIGNTSGQGGSVYSPPDPSDPLAANQMNEYLIAKSKGEATPAMELWMTRYKNNVRMKFQDSELQSDIHGFIDLFSELPETMSYLSEAIDEFPSDVYDAVQFQKDLSEENRTARQERRDYDRAFKESMKEAGYGPITHVLNRMLWGKINAENERDEIRARVAEELAQNGY